MSRFRLLISRVRTLFCGTAAERDFDSEVKLHIDLLTERYVRQGLSPDEARRAARLQFGGAAQLKEELREQRSLLLFENFVQDTRYALRQLRKAPVFCFTAVLTLALGIGINTAVFSVIYAVLLRPLPYKNPDELTMIWEQNVRRGWFHNIVSAANFNDWSKDNHVFTDMALVDPFLTFNLTGHDVPVEVSAERVTPNLFSVLAVQPFLGRVFLPEEGRPGSARVVILGHALWARCYGSDRSIIGKHIALNSENYTVIGVMPPRFRADYSRRVGRAAQIWVSALDRSDPERTAHGYIAIGRLRPGVTLQRAQAEMDTIAARLQARYPDNKDWGVGITSMHDELVGDSRPALLILLAAVALVLMIPCANLANLLLARSAVRGRELAVRQALGAGRRRLLAQLLTETFLLSAFGAVVGLWLASFGVKGLIAIAPIDTPGIDSAGLQSVVLLYAAALALLTTMLFGVVPALGISSSNLNNGLKEGSRNSTDGNRQDRLRKVFVSAEFSMALVLAVSAGLMVKTLVYMHDVELGFQPDRVLTLRVPLNDVKYNEIQQAEFYRTLLARLKAVPDIHSASVSRGIPFFGWAGQGFVTEENPKPAVSEMPDANVIEVGPEYFNVLRISLLRGRVFAENDTAGRLPVAVVNEALARKQWPGRNPLGKRIRIGDRSPWLTIIGVTGNVRTEGPDADFLPEIYMCYLQHPWVLTPRNLLIRTRTTNPLAVLPSVRNVIHQLDPDQPIADVRTLNAVVEEPLALRSFLAYLLGGFALLALALAAIGVYGVMAYAVSQRLREIGIRMALGASQRQVIRYFVRDGLQIGAIGLLIGFIGSFAATRLLSTQLCGVKASDPQIFATVFLLLACIAICASYVPARRAARIDPLSVLRDE